MFPSNTSTGFPFVGVLFTGLMMTKSGPKTLEYNVRFGDPETQSLLALLETDLAELMLACVDGKLDTVNLSVSPKSAVTVVVAAGGYPGSYAKGTKMELDEVPKGE
jgi:phosphoribosylamine--glycine ligase/phosphoribosylformylglycinamidine cyclo-ligase